jgi:uncharacterized protein
MDKEKIIEKTIELVKNKLEGEGSGHDFWHVYRVYKISVSLSMEEKEEVDLYIVKLGALLHDIADWKFNDGDTTVGADISRDFLSSLGVDDKTIEQVAYIVENISFKGAGDTSKMNTIEGKIVQDADRLDALGAIGIARTFAYGGHAGREIYNPNIKYEEHKTFEQYKNSTGTSVNHFYEKLLLLKDRMNTKPGKSYAEKRHKFMEEYLKEFYAEWEGKL